MTSYYVKHTVRVDFNEFEGHVLVSEDLEGCKHVLVQAINEESDSDKAYAEMVLAPAMAREVAKALLFMADELEKR